VSDSVLHADATPRTLGFIRIWVFGAWFADVAKDPITDLATLPIETFERIGVLRLIPMEAWQWVLTPSRLEAATAVLLVGLALSAGGVQPYRPIALATCVLLTLYQGLILGFTYAGHSTLAALPVAYVLAVFPSADALALRRRGGQANGTLAVLAMVTATFCFLATYSFIGALRLELGGLEIFLDGTILKYVARNSLSPGFLDGQYGVSALEDPWISGALLVGFPIVSLFELLSPLCLFSRAFRRAWTVVLLVFHVVTWPLMQLLFVHTSC
jgi:hypothetical protein